MRWFEFTVTTSQEMIDWIADVFHANGADGVAIEDGEVLNRVFDSPYGEMNGLNPDDYPAEGARIKGYVHEGIDRAVLFDHLKETLAQWQADGTDVGEAKIEQREVLETDWATAWQDYYHPLIITNRIGIAPTWEPFEVGQAPEIVIELDPGMAFGTGTHPTTTLCIKQLEKQIQSKDIYIADVGTGTAVLAIVAAKLGAAKVLALDVDPVAVDSAQRNCLQNHVLDRVKIVENAIGTPLAEYGPAPQGIVANLLAEIIIQLADDFTTWIQPGGWGIFSGIISDKKEKVISCLESKGWTIQFVEQDGDWIVITAIAPNVQREDESV